MYVQIQFVVNFCSIWQNIGWPMTASHTMRLQWLSFLLFNQHLLSKAFTSVVGYFTISGVNWSRFLDAGSSYCCITNKVKTLTEELIRWQISTMATTTMTIIKNLKKNNLKIKKNKSNSNDLSSRPGTECMAELFVSGCLRFTCNECELLLIWETCRECNPLQSMCH